MVEIRARDLKRRSMTTYKVPLRSCEGAKRVHLVLLWESCDADSLRAVPG